MSAVALASTPDLDDQPAVISPEPPPASTTPGPTFWRALIAAKAEFPAIVRDSENPHMRSMYASLAANLQVEPILFKHGFVIVQVPIEAPGGWQLQTRLIHESGQELVSHMPLIVGTDRNAMQSLGSTLTYARRYSLQCLLCLHAEDDDGNGSGASAPPRQTPQEPRQTPQQSAPPKTQATRYPPGGAGLLDWLTDLTNQQRFNWVEWAQKLTEPHGYGPSVAEWDQTLADWVAEKVRAEIERRAKANQSKRR